MSDSSWFDDITARIAARRHEFDTVMASINTTTERHLQTLDDYTGVLVRLPSPDGSVIPEINYLGQLTDLWIKPGATTTHSGAELAKQIMAAIVACNDDANKRRTAIYERVEAHD